MSPFPSCLRTWLLALFLIVVPFGTMYAIDDALLIEMEIDPEVEYYIRLQSGDVITGLLSPVATDGRGSNVSITTSVGVLKVYAQDIAWIGTREQAHRARNRGFVIPTAEPIGRDFYIGVTSAAIPTVGFGLFDIGSVVLARSFIPGLSMREQLSLVNLKATVYEAENGLVESGRQFFAVGINGTWINDVNFIGHLYGVGTFTGTRSRVSSVVFSKAFGRDDYTVNLGTLGSSFRFPYASGTFGVGLMIDVRFPEFHDLHAMAELWGVDIGRPAQSAFVVGLRKVNTATTYDFGLALLPGGALAPVINFAYTP
ncbi:MAG: hypothetical protein FGM32_10780 [Candidatus Kapabacteria bacterium]|nr:hypothetical protein [Candidatus Kapabacteria bacterium]